MEISSEDEIGKLAQSFERMRVSIKKVMDLLK
ncbi:MAG: HAMP domain-containing protein [Aquificaceae bacterium]